MSCPKEDTNLLVVACSCELRRAAVRVAAAASSLPGRQELSDGKDGGIKFCAAAPSADCPAPAAPPAALWRGKRLHA